MALEVKSRVHIGRRRGGFGRPRVQRNTAGFRAGAICAPRVRAWREARVCEDSAYPFGVRGVGAVGRQRRGRSGARRATARCARSAASSFSAPTPPATAPSARVRPPSRAGSRSPIAGSRRPRARAGGDRHCSPPASLVAPTARRTARPGWIVRKVRVVDRFGRSSLNVGERARQSGDDLRGADAARPAILYAAHGGAFPVTVRGVGVVGHRRRVRAAPAGRTTEFVVEVLSEFLGVALEDS